jgi:hypothetical protein
MKTTIRNLTAVFVLFLLVSLAGGIRTDNFFVSTLFNVSGIIFSVGLGLIVTFNFSGIKNKVYIKQVRRNIAKVRNSFLIHFALLSFCYVVEKYLRDNNFSSCVVTIKSFQIILYWPFLICLVMLHSIFYYIVNFLKIQKLSDDIFDKTNEP